MTGNELPTAELSLPIMIMPSTSNQKPFQAILGKIQKLHTKTGRVVDQLTTVYPHHLPAAVGRVAIAQPQLNIQKTLGGEKLTCYNENSTRTDVEGHPGKIHFLILPPDLKLFVYPFVKSSFRH
jgi:hypothetical protein